MGVLFRRLVSVRRPQAAPAPMVHAPAEVEAEAD